MSAQPLPFPSRRPSRRGLGDAHLGAGGRRALGPGVPARLPALGECPGRRGPHAGDLHPGVPLARGVQSRHVRGLAAPDHHEPVPGHGPSSAEDPVRRAAG